MSIISCTSPSPSAMILPDSSVTSRPSSDFNSRKALPSCRTVSPRTGPGVTRHFSNASCAGVIIFSYSASVAVRTRASNLPSMGENFSMTGPPPIQSPQKAPGFSSTKPSFFRIDCISGGSSAPRSMTTWRRTRDNKSIARGAHDPPSFAHLPALLTQELHRFVNNFGGNIERGTKTNGAFARFQDECAAIEHALPEFIAHFRIGQIEGEEESASAHSGHDRLGALQFLQRV